MGPLAGWHPDPDVRGGQRYFDGTAWTKHRVGPPPVLPPTPEAVEQQRLTRKTRHIVWGVIGFIAVAVLLVVAFAPTPPVHYSPQEAACHAQVDAHAARIAAAGFGFMTPQAQIDEYAQCMLFARAGLTP